MAGVVKVLIVDDSAYVRKVVRQMLNRSPFLEVIGAARDGEEALELVEQLRPDVVTLDLNMPCLDGVGFLRQQMARRPIPVVLLSIASESAELAIQALDAGAVDLVRKPTALASERVFEVADDLIAKVKAAALVNARAPLPPVAPAPKRMAARPRRADIVVMGVSTGGPQALKQVIPGLPGDFPVPVAIVLHIPIGFTEPFARSLNEAAALSVVEAREGQPVVPGVAVIAPAGYHLTFDRRPDGLVVSRLTLKPIDTPHRPAVDVLFRSAAETYADRVLAVVLTGMGSDGLQGAAWVKAQGGRVFHQSEESCVVYGMPRSIAEAGLSDAVVALSGMAQAIIEGL